MVDHHPHKRAWSCSMCPPAQKEGGEGVVSFSVANSGVRLWVSYLNRKRQQCQRSCRQEKIQKFSPRGGQLGAAVGSRLGVCVTRTLRTVRDNSTSVCRAESLRHLAWNQISVKAGGITERRDDLRGDVFMPPLLGGRKAGHVQWPSTPSDWDISPLQTHSAKESTR